MEIVKVTPKSQEIDRICGREVAPSKEIHDKVMDILADIKNGGYAKAVEYAQKLVYKETEIRGKLTVHDRRLHVEEYFCHGIISHIGNVFNGLLTSGNQIIRVVGLNKEAASDLNEDTSVLRIVIGNRAEKCNAESHVCCLRSSNRDRS